MSADTRNKLSRDGLVNKFVENNLIAWDDNSFTNLYSQILVSYPDCTRDDLGEVLVVLKGLYQRTLVASKKGEEYALLGTIVDYGFMYYQLEWNRVFSLQNNASLLLAIMGVIATLVTFIPGWLHYDSGLVYNKLNNISLSSAVLWASLFFFLLSLFFSVLVLWPGKFKALPGPLLLDKNLLKNKDLRTSFFDLINWMDEACNGISNYVERRKSYYKLALFYLAVSLFLALIGILFIKHMIIIQILLLSIIVFSIFFISINIIKGVPNDKFKSTAFIPTKGS
jgi:hypothetical protein